MFVFIYESFLCRSCILKYIYPNYTSCRVKVEMEMKVHATEISLSLYYTSILASTSTFTIKNEDTMPMLKRRLDTVSRHEIGMPTHGSEPTGSFKNLC